jgi:hypothetical protein
MKDPCSERSVRGDFRQEREWRAFDCVRVREFVDCGKEMPTDGNPLAFTESIERSD